MSLYECMIIDHYIRWMTQNIDYKLILYSLIQCKILITIFSRNFPNSFQILSLDFNQKLPYRLKHTHLHPCKLNHVVFEICYVSAIKDSSSCRNIVSNSKDLNWSSRGRGFIISSGAEDPLFLRGKDWLFNRAGGWRMASAAECDYLHLLPEATS